MTNTRGLARFREGESQPILKAWEPPTRWREDLTILSVDQSLTALGWVLLESRPGALNVLKAGSLLLKPADYPGGHEGSLMRADEVFAYMARERKQVSGWVDLVVHETPPLAVGRMARPESSLMSAVAVRIALSGLKIALVQNQHSKKVLTGASREVTKKQWHAGLAPFPISGMDMVTNEGQRDALCLAMTYLIDTAGDRRG